MSTTYWLATIFAWLLRLSGTHRWLAGISPVDRRCCCRVSILTDGPEVEAYKRAGFAIHASDTVVQAPPSRLLIRRWAIVTGNFLKMEIVGAMETPDRPDRTMRG